MATYAITGANRGIGLEMTRQLIERGDTVVALCRQPSAELEALGARVVDGVDVTSDEVVAAARESLEGTDIDVLVNNAGLLTRESLDDLDFDQIRRQMEVNALGPLRVTAALLGSLHAGSKVVLITSRMGSIEDNTSGGRYGYRMSKAALNMAGMSLARDLAERRIAVGILHPGFVRTDMTGHQGMVDPSESAANLIQRIDELSLESSGTFWHANGEVLPW